MQNFLMMARAIAETSSFGTATGDGRIGHVDTRDVAAVAAEIAASPAAHAGKTYWPTGDVATILGGPPRSLEQFATDYAAAFWPTLVAR
jgi:uncharacterized protein YbjT (DUF2867 family)